MEYGEMKINRGKKRIFEEIEKSANILCAKGLITCAAITTVIGIIAAIVDKSEYMQSVIIAFAIAVVVCVAMACYSLMRKKHGSLHVGGCGNTNCTSYIRGRRKRAAIIIVIVV